MFMLKRFDKGGWQARVGHWVHEGLKTLFNIVEAPFKKWLNFDVVYDDVQLDQ